MNDQFVIVLVSTLITAISTLLFCRQRREDFTAPGLVFNIPSEWWHPKKYNNIDWLTPMNLDQLSQPSCLSYNRGNAEILNYSASAYKFWRF